MALLFFCYQMLWIITIILITSIFLENDWIENISLEITECYVKAFVGKTCIEVDFSSPLLLYLSSFMFCEGEAKKNHVGFHRVMSHCQWPKKHRHFRAENSSDDLQFTLCVLGEIAVGTRGCLSTFLPGPNSYKLTPSFFCYGPMRELTEHRSSLPHLAWGPDRPWFWFHSPSLATS